MDLKEISNQGSQQIALTSTLDGRSIVVFVKSIIYIARHKDSNNTYVHYHDVFTGRWKCVSVRGSLTDFVGVLPNQFHKVNRSTIVNLRYVVSYTDDEVEVWAPDEQIKFPHTNHISRYLVEF